MPLEIPRRPRRRGSCRTDRDRSRRLSDRRPRRGPRVRTPSKLLLGYSVPTKSLASKILLSSMLVDYDAAMDDTTDRLLEAWADVRPDLEVDALQVTARLTRVGAHLARRQDAVFGRFG